MNAIFALGMTPLGALVIGMVVLLLFGNRLPSVMRSLGRGVVEFKKGAQGLDDEESEEEPAKSPKEKV
jgi:sec-independent protein translocase protein TatA